MPSLAARSLAALLLLGWLAPVACSDDSADTASTAGAGGAKGGGAGTGQAGAAGPGGAGQSGAGQSGAGQAGAGFPTGGTAGAGGSGPGGAAGQAGAAGTSGSSGQAGQAGAGAGAGGQAGEAGAGGTPDAYEAACAAIGQRFTTCGGDATGEAEKLSCLGSRPCGESLIATDELAAVMACMAATPCTGNPADCLYQLPSDSSSTAAAKKVLDQSCQQKTAQCDQKGDPFTTSVCRFPVVYDPKLIQTVAQCVQSWLCEKKEGSCSAGLVTSQYPQCASGGWRWVE